MVSSGDARITQGQLELLQTFKYLTSEKEIAEVKELLHLYYRHKLDAAIEEEENARGYTAEVYESWLKSKGGA